MSDSYPSRDQDDGETPVFPRIFDPNMLPERPAAVQPYLFARHQCNRDSERSGLEPVRPRESYQAGDLVVSPIDRNWWHGPHVALVLPRFIRPEISSGLRTFIGPRRVGDPYPYVAFFPRAELQLLACPEEVASQQFSIRLVNLLAGFSASRNRFSQAFILLALLESLLGKELRTWLNPTASSVIRLAKASGWTESPLPNQALPPLRTLG